MIHLAPFRSARQIEIFRAPKQGQRQADLKPSISEGSGLLHPK